MKWIVLCGALVGCSSAQSVDRAVNEPGQEEPGDEVIPDAGTVEVTSDDAATAGDSSTIEPDASDSTAEEDAACRQEKCISLTCGELKSVSCHGRPIDCGVCSKGYQCGDNNVDNHCGYFCQETGQVNLCNGSALGFTPKSAFNYGCKAPYFVDTITGKLTSYRANGTQGCKSYMPNSSTNLLCCP